MLPPEQIALGRTLRIAETPVPVFKVNILSGNSASVGQSERSKKWRATQEKAGTLGCGNQHGWRIVLNFSCTVPYARNFTPEAYFTVRHTKNWPEPPIRTDGLKTIKKERDAMANTHIQV